MPVASPTASPGDRLTVMLPMITPRDSPVTPRAFAGLTVTLIQDERPAAHAVRVRSLERARSEPLGLTAAIVTVSIPPEATAGPATLRFELGGHVAAARIYLTGAP